MKKLLYINKLYGSVLIYIVLNSCSDLEEDCICTEEYRFYLVTVVDTLSVPIDSLDITIKDSDGDELNALQDPHPFGARKGTIIKFTRKNLPIGFISITRGSFRNSNKYFLTSFTDGLSGVPRFISNTQVFAI